MAFSKYIEPFKVFNNIYFVGNKDVSVHVIDTGNGLIMIDTGYPYMYEIILDNMQQIGLDPHNLSILLLSHGHIDHIGCATKLKQLSGARIAISREDNNIINGSLNLSWADELKVEHAEPFSGDILIDNGDIIKLGNTSIRCISAPGHTAGTIALFFETKNENSSFVCAMHGGVGTNSMESSFLKKYGLSLNCRDVFRDGLHYLANEHVDIVLGNHPDQNDTEGKLLKLRAGNENAFINSSEWGNFLSSCEKRLDHMISEESKNI